MDPKEIEEGVQKAIEYREQARTFRTPVGVAFYVHNSWLGGFNIEKYAYNGYHAEEVALIRGLARGFYGTDFTVMTEVFQDAGHSDVEIFPGCAFSCWGVMNAFTHQALEVKVADTSGKVHYETTLGEITRPPSPGQVFPSEKIKGIKPLTNAKPRGDGAEALEIGTIMSSQQDIDSMIKLALSFRDRSIVFAPTQQLVFDAVAFGMKNNAAFGGLRVQTYNHKGYRPEETAGILSLVGGYNDSDFSTVLGIIPDFVSEDNAIPFMSSLFATWETVADFASMDIRVVGVDTKKNVQYDGSLVELLRNAEAGAKFVQELKSSIRVRKNSQPKLKLKE